MHRAPAAAFLIAALLTGAGCKPARPPAARADLAEARVLALGAPGGDGAVDRQILGLQERVRRAAVADDWVLLGQAWIQKARHAGDPASTSRPTGRRRWRWRWSQATEARSASTRWCC